MADQDNLSSTIIEYGLRIISRDFEEENVRVIVVENIGPILTPEGVIELTKGSEYDLPRWIAYKLVNKKLVEIKDESLELEKLAKIAYTEESTQRKIEFSKIHRYFYHLVIEEINKLYNKFEEERNTRILMEIQRFEDYIDRIGSSRLRKIVRLLFIEPPQEIINKLSEEELILYNNLKSMLKKWLKKLRVEKGV